MTLPSINISYGEGKEEESPIELIINDSVGWSEYLEVKVIIKDQKIRETANIIAIGYQEYSFETKSYSSIFTTQEVYSDYEKAPFLIKNRMHPIYSDFRDIEGEYIENFVYSQEEELTFYIHNFNIPTRELQSNIYVGLYSIETTDEDTYHKSMKNTLPVNVTVIAGEQLYKVTETSVVEGRYDILRESFKIDYPFKYEFKTEEIIPTDNNYTGGMYIEGIMGPQSYNYLGTGLDLPLSGRLVLTHRMIALYGEDVTTDQGLRDIIIRNGYHISTDVTKRVPAPQDLMSKYNADLGYFIAVDELGYPEESGYIDGAGETQIVTHQEVDSTRVLLLFEKDICHLFYLDIDLNNVEGDELESWLNKIDYYILGTARSLDKFPYRESEMITIGGSPVLDAPAGYEISIPSESITVFNNGTYNTGTKRDSSFTLPIRVKVPENHDPSKKLYVKGTVVTEDKNPSIIFNDEGDLKDISYKYVNEDIAVFYVMTKGIKGGEHGGLVYTPNQKIKLELVDENLKSLTGPLMFDVNLVDASPRVIFDQAKVNQIQSKGTSVVNFKIKDPDSETFKAEIKVPFGRIRLPDGEWAKTISFEGTIDELYKIGFEAPEIGNFKLNEEMQSLSMWALQKSTIENALIDYAGSKISKFSKKDFGNGSYAKRMLNSGYVDFDNYEEKAHFMQMLIAAKKTGEKFKMLDDAYSKMAASYNAHGIFSEKGRESLGNDLYEASKTENKGAFEIGMDIGVGCFSLAQSGVGILTSITNKIPGIGETTSEKIALFNLTIGVWKGNIQYLSKMEKIDRAKERIEFIPIIINVTDDSGFKSRGVMMLPVVGMEI